MKIFTIKLYHKNLIVYKTCFKIFCLTKYYICKSQINQVQIKRDEMGDTRITNYYTKYFVFRGLSFGYPKNSLC